MEATVCVGKHAAPLVGGGRPRVPVCNAARLWEPPALPGEELCPPGEAGSPGPREPEEGLFRALAAQCATHLHGNYSDKLPAALPAEAPGSQAMDVPGNSQFCHGSQGHVSIGTGPRTAGSEGSQL